MSETRDCPMCAETIKALALKCRFCGANLAIRGGPCKFCGGPMQKEIRCRQVSTAGSTLGLLFVLIGLSTGVLLDIRLGAILILVGFILFPAFKTQYNILVCAECYKTRYTRS